jgi:hypothetical protein
VKQRVGGGADELSTSKRNRVEPKNDVEEVVGLLEIIEEGREAPGC